MGAQVHVIRQTRRGSRYVEKCRERSVEIVIADEVQTEERKYPTRPGLTRTQPLLSCEAPDGLCFRLVRSRYQGGDKAFETPRHHHTFQQIRFSESGTLNFAPGQDIAEGDIAYFPRAAYYGPQMRDHGIGLTVQFGFGNEMLGGKDALQVYYRGVEKLRTLGKVGNGTFTDTDPVTGEERIRDTWQAVAEETTGEKFVFPPERYAGPILMHPREYNYYEVGPGVEVKHLGKFYDHSGPNGDVRISMIRFSGGGAQRLGSDRTQLAWTTSPGLLVDARTYPELTCLYSPRGEEVTISGTNGVEVYLVEFPRLD